MFVVQDPNWVGACALCDAIEVRHALDPGFGWHWCPTTDCPGQVVRLNPTERYLAAYLLGGYDAIRAILSAER